MNKLTNTLSTRLSSLDVFRGFTIASMILVNNPGSWDHIFTQLDHAHWHGCTFTDLIFPFFLWIIGVSITLSFAKRIEQGSKRSNILRHIFWRTLILFVVGLFLNGFPFGLIGSHTFSLTSIRITGVLQRIALCYFFASIIVLYTKVTWQIIWTVMLLIGTWILVKTVSVPGFGAGILEPNGSLFWYIDSTLLHGHTWARAPIPGFDPEGILSSLPAIATTLFGALTGQLLLSNKSPTEKTIWMLVGGIAFIGLGLLMNHWLPINKSLWTSSYAVFTAGIATVTFACCYWLVDIKKYEKLFKPLQIYGMNALTTFVISILILRLTMFIQVKQWLITTCSLKSYYYKVIFLPIGNEMLASLLHAVFFVLFMYLVAYILYRTKIIIKA